MFALILLPFAAMLWAIELVFAVTIIFIAFAVQLVLFVLNILLWPLVWLLSGANKHQKEDYDNHGINIT